MLVFDDLIYTRILVWFFFNQVTMNEMLRNGVFYERFMEQVCFMWFFFFHREGFLYKLRVCDEIVKGSQRVAMLVLGIARRRILLRGNV